MGKPMKHNNVVRLKESSVDKAFSLMAEKDIDEVVICGIKGSTLYLGTSKIDSDTRMIGILEGLKMFVWEGPNE